MKIATILGTRPEIIKLSPLIEMLDSNFDHTLIHTGQHYDPNMDREVFRELKLKYPKTKLTSSHGKFSEQISSQINFLYETFFKIKPDYVIVQGDTNSAMSGALVAARLKIKVVHIEAGCRSGNIKAPEEQNRLIIDAISSIALCADKKSYQNLIKENKKNQIHYTGSTTFDALKRSSKISDKIKSSDLYQPESYVLVTLHRAENLEDENNFRKKIELLDLIAEKTNVIFPIHPRTLKYLKERKIQLNPNIRVTEPLNHLAFIRLLKNCRFVLTDSGGIQEEAAYFNRPCLVLRNETEWTRFIKAKKNFLIKNLDLKDYTFIEKLLVNDEFYQKIRKRKCPEVQVGAASKIINILKKEISLKRPSNRAF